jgi:hypothetical protein
MIKKKLKLILGIIGVLVLIFFCWLFIGRAPIADDISWGVAFSQKYSEELGLDWKENYLALLDDLEISNVKIIAYWDLIEPQKGEYYFDDLDFKINEAEKRDVGVMLVLGRKVPRWPECHIPQWAENLNKEEQKESTLEMIEKVILRYRENDSIWAWQVENEPFFEFGGCPESYEVSGVFLRKEVGLVKSLDFKNRPVVISDSGSNRFWFKVARIGDIVSISLYRKVWFHEFDRYVNYPFPPVFYWRKSQIIDKIFGKKVICGELQAEPWGRVPVPDLPFEEHGETMNLEQFRDNINFAKKTGFDYFYLWGAEWWYWMKEEKDMPSIWNEAKSL